MKIQDKETFDKVNVFGMDKKTLHLPSTLSVIPI